MDNHIDVTTTFEAIDEAGRTHVVTVVTRYEMSRRRNGPGRQVAVSVVMKCDGREVREVGSGRFEVVELGLELWTEDGAGP